MKILVPVDGSPASIRAIKLAIDQVKTVPGATRGLANVVLFAIRASAAKWHG
jgi:nucleotide-binding universal stress UspA family protein